MVREALEQASREELIELTLSTHAVAESERARAEALAQQLLWFKKQLFGAKSEKRRDLEPDPSQLALGESIAVGDTTAEAAGTVVRAHVRKRTGSEKSDPDDVGLRFDASVPVETIVVEDPEVARLGAEAFVQITEKRSYKLAQRPASYVVLEFVRRVVKEKATDRVSCPPVPSSPLPGTYADVSLLAGLLVDKFRYHLPLYRQHQRIQAAGITISRMSLTHWVHDALDLLEPIYKAQLASILTSRVIAMDETPIRAGRKGHGKMKTGYFWPVYGDRDEVAFPFAESRARLEVEKILGEYGGTLLSDGYHAYDHYAEQRAKVVHALCWSHTRRGFIEAEAVDGVRSTEAIRRIGELYEIEEEIRKRKLEPEAKQLERGSRSRPIVAGFFEWLKHEMATSALLPSNPFTKAAAYALERQQGLEVFLANPEVAIDTNHLERTLRPIPMGKKNWLFCWTEVGAEKVGWAQSLIATCVLHEVDPYAYLVDVLQRIDTHPSSRIEELTPRLWREVFADRPMKSLLDRTKV